MTMRTQELHPALVHYPITLYPVSLAADAVGRLTGSRTLLGVGRWGMVLSAGATAVAGLAGFMAQEQVRARGAAADLLITHRNLNIGFLAGVTAMAAARLVRPRPSLRYLAAGAGLLGAMAYSAYLGGHMVYEHGVGVVRARGVRAGAAPELRPENARRIARQARQDVAQAVRHTARDLGHGAVVPWLTRGDGGNGAGGVPAGYDDAAAQPAPGPLAPERARTP
jgi:uncharacterized membrane protein